MASFSYIAINRAGEEVHGSMEAANADIVRSRLKIDGMAVVSVSKENFFTKDLTFGTRKKVTVRDLSVFCRQFSSILKAGVTLADALQMMYDQTENKTLKAAIQKAREGVQQGDPLSTSMGRSSDVFPDMFVFMVAAGEQSGHLDTAVARMGHQFERSSKLQGEIRKAMIYPIAVVFVAVTVLIVMSVLVLPRFAETFISMGTDLPWSTKALMAISDFIIYKWYLLVAIIAIVVVIINYARKTPGGQLTFGRWALKLPMIGKLNAKSYAASFSRTFSTLLSSGMGMIQAIDITAKTLNNALFKRALEKAKTEVEQGTRLSVPLKRSGIFPSLICNMMAIGEDTSDIEGMLDKVADYYEEETSMQVAIMTELMQPLIIVVLGVMIGLMVLAMYQPMINMYGGMSNL